MQFDLYTNPNNDTKEGFPYLLDIQSDILNKLATRIVVPLTPEKNIRHKIKIVQPLFTVLGEKYVALFDELSSFPKSLLKDKVDNLSDERALIMEALDFILQGY